ncbi:hypothetical protein JD844_005090 [Phrynosoma platyrhinos]|uniref:Lipocalin/cytosolic fatty-acid binding domain-containing protein n=1 Tax=Phrynosoma platyrhinos TaxID=52577 RepID=A0ABQ7SE69_PHRPL|nr:hypothetical protein JD844_005090 [Phrynosoma platyrhinos]
MRTMVLSILWGFARHFGAASEVPVMPGVEAWRMMGVWYPISVVTDHRGQKHLSIKGRFTLCTPPDSLYYDFYFIGGEHCYLEIVNFLVDERPGQFITESDDPEYDGCKVRIVDTDYHEYNIFHMERDGNKTLILDGMR